MEILTKEDIEKRMKELEKQGIILKTPRERMKDFFNIDIKDNEEKEVENMDNLDVVELRILQSLVDKELNEIEKGEVKKHKQYEFDLMLLNHKIEALIRGSER